MKEATPPILSGRGRPAEPNVVACAIALFRKEHFDGGEPAAKELFRVNPKTELQERWVDGYLAEFAPAGFNSTGPALPPYLLDRADAEADKDVELLLEMTLDRVPTYVDLAGLCARHGPMRKVRPDGSLQSATERAGWLSEHLRTMEEREREYAAWRSSHAAERQAQVARLRESEDAFYWVLADKQGSKHKWQLKAAEHLEADVARMVDTQEACELGIEEPLLACRAFRAFEGDLQQAERFCAARGRERDMAWFEAERATLGDDGAARPPRRRCLECDLCECACPGDDDPQNVDPYGQESADCAYENVHAWVARDERSAREEVQRARPPKPEDMEYERMCDWVYDDDGRRSLFYGRPATELPSGCVAPRDWEPPSLESLESLERERRREAEYLEWAARRCIPPPHRDDAAYGPNVNNAAGDAAFREARRKWYEHVTGECIGNLPMSDQWALCDRHARRFRAYTDGRRAVTMADPDSDASSDMSVSEPEHLQLSPRDFEHDSSTAERIWRRIQRLERRRPSGQT